MFVMDNILQVSPRDKDTHHPLNSFSPAAAVTPNGWRHRRAANSHLTLMCHSITAVNFVAAIFLFICNTHVHNGHQS